ncbi:MAG: hypothetical protein ACTSU5_04415 [Promethearchaeota archaeon]
MELNENFWKKLVLGVLIGVVVFVIIVYAAGLQLNTFQVTFWGCIAVLAVTIVYVTQLEKEGGNK